VENLTTQLESSEGRARNFEMKLRLGHAADEKVEAAVHAKEMIKSQQVRSI
jgi:hypothetical protein